LSNRVNPEVYHTLVGSYREEVRRLINHHGGHINSTKGDGLLALFGHPTAHEDDGGIPVSLDSG
jgi:class 3 adenylate cyclase